MSCPVQVHAGVPTIEPMLEQPARDPAPDATHASSEPWAHLPWRAGFAALGPRFSTPTPASPLASPHWVACNDGLRQDLGLPEGGWDSERVRLALAGNATLPGSDTHATVYSGHQFGVWAGQLGDGRALSLGTLDTPLGPQELQLKGAGRTPYSRMGDGRAVLRSSIREYLASEAMHALGIPTTRALCVVGSPTPVRRETLETAAVVTRVAPSFVRFGHFEHFAQANDRDALHQLCAHIAAHHRPALQDVPAERLPLALLEDVVQRTADLIAQWQAVGFCHGVMNTDNMSVLGLTLDYGPFQFMDGFDAHHICNHSDTQGRYAYARQPQIAYWNLFCLGQALLPLVGDTDEALRVLQGFQTRYAQALRQQFNAKLGLTELGDADDALQQDLLQHMHQERTDWTVFWRRLSHAVAESATVASAFEPVQDLFLDRAPWQTWLARYQARLDAQGTSRAAVGARMQRTNPKFVLRNHLGELAIRAAQDGDFRLLADLHAVLQSPFDEHPAHEAWAGLAPEWASSIAISCSS